MRVDDYIHEVLQNETDFSKRLKQSDIIRNVRKAMIDDEKVPASRNTIIRHLKDMATVLEKFDNPDVDLEYCSSLKPGVYCDKSEKGELSNFWLKKPLTDKELRFLLDSVLYSKILTQTQSDDLIDYLRSLSGKQFAEDTKYINNMLLHPYINQIDTLENLQIVQDAIRQKKKIKFTLNTYNCVYNTLQHEFRLAMVPMKSTPYICDPYEIIFNNDRYYLIAADKKQQKMGQYRYYRLDLMTDISISKVAAKTKFDEIKLDTDNLGQYTTKNQFLFTGTVKQVKLRVRKDRFLYIIDNFGIHYSPVKMSEKDKHFSEHYVDIKVEVNTTSFIYWVLQYSECVTVLEPASFRKQVENTLKEILARHIAQGDKMEVTYYLTKLNGII